jgi:type I restriction enzyme M protein
MGNEAGTTDRLVTRAELADLAGVRRPTITTWAKRHQDFPQPAQSIDGDYFTLASVVAWLDRRPIPAKERSADEPAGFTYGQRVRRRSFGLDDDPPARSAYSEGARSEQTLDRLLGPLATRIRGGAGSQADYLTLLICLVFLRGRAAPQWAELRRITGSATEETRRDRLIWRIGDLTDQALRLKGIMPGVQLRLERLKPRSVMSSK